METKNFNELYEEIIKLKNVEECEAFFDDLFTVAELEALAGRIRAAKMLMSGSTFLEVTEATSISSATLARVSKCIKHGSGGYRKILSRKSHKK